MELFFHQLHLTFEAIMKYDTIQNPLECLKKYLIPRDGTKFTKLQSVIKLPHTYTPILALKHFYEAELAHQRKQNHHDNTMSPSQNTSMVNPHHQYE